MKKTWKSKKFKAKSHILITFREYYGQLAEIRSLLKPTLLVAITGTASKQVQNIVTKSLAMIDYLYVGSCPNRENIMYTVIKLKTDNTESNSSWLIDERKVKRNKAEKCIVFCRSH